MNICQQHLNLMNGIYDNREEEAQIQIIKIQNYTEILISSNNASSRNIKVMEEQQEIQIQFGGLSLYQEIPKNIGMKLDINTKSVSQRNDKEEKTSALKKWFTILKTVLKQNINIFNNQQQNIIKDFSFSFGDSLQIIRKLFGFIKTKNQDKKRFEQIEDCSNIRNFLLSIIDSCQIMNTINSSKFQRRQKLELISTIDYMRDLIINPNMIV